jgi:hypothetical protein
LSSITPGDVAERRHVVAHPALHLQQQVGGAGDGADVVAVLGLQVESFVQRGR